MSPPFIPRGLADMTSVAKKTFASRVQLELPDMRFFVLSDVWLDKPDTLLGLRKMFDNCMENSFIPKVIVLCGNFTSTGVPQGNGREVRKYQGMANTHHDLFLLAK